MKFVKAFCGYCSVWEVGCLILEIKMGLRHSWWCQRWSQEGWRRKSLIHSLICIIMLPQELLNTLNPKKRKPKHQKKKKIKTKKQTNHDIRIIDLKDAKFRNYYQQIRWKMQSKVENTFRIGYSNWERGKSSREDRCSDASVSMWSWPSGVGWLSSDQWTSAWGGEGRESFF